MYTHTYEYIHVYIDAQLFPYQSMTCTTYPIPLGPPFALTSPFRGSVTAKHLGAAGRDNN